MSGAEPLLYPCCYGYVLNAAFIHHDNGLFVSHFSKVHIQMNKKCTQITQKEDRYSKSSVWNFKFYSQQDCFLTLVVMVTINTYTRHVARQLGNMDAKHNIANDCLARTSAFPPDVLGFYKNVMRRKSG